MLSYKQKIVQAPNNSIFSPDLDCYVGLYDKHSYQFSILMFFGFFFAWDETRLLAPSFIE